VYANKWVKSLRTTKLLVERYGFSMFDIESKGSLNAFLIAAELGYTNHMEYFIKSDPSILKTVDNEKNNALHISALKGTLQGTKFLVEKHGFNEFDDSNDMGRNAFLCSVSRCDHMYIHDVFASDINKCAQFNQVKYFLKRKPDILVSVDSKKKNNALTISPSDSLIEEFLVNKAAELGFKICVNTVGNGHVLGWGCRKKPDERCDQPRACCCDQVDWLVRPTE